ncbi:tartrate decarboxylase [Gonapodya prolifera JEL478]|uniref:D-malate dehydrogenase (decarboxylating) n=1 Tax=Gonapodya prolifera (strain JEL478) TaxID=1344416 RepID=A0A139AE93_GONPJ|nr:tartrate decarboxylase [Gonapodya prolifera JEL478]|eukprot:KXS15080.1 tartrate decarboxylase [Gonapodya prolifera JEL478]
MPSTVLKIAAVPGDGIGKETVPEGIKVVDAAAERFGFKVEWTHFNDWTCENYAKTGTIVPGGIDEGIKILKAYDSIFLGAVGWPGVADHISLWDLLIPIRRAFGLFANVRPAQNLPGVRCPLANKKPGDIDLLIVRENVEGEYSQVGGRIYQGTEDDIAIQEAIFTRRGVDRIIRYAFELARSRPKKHLTSATKSNGIIHSMPFWDERFNAIKKEYPDVKTNQFHIDILCARLVTNPEWFDTIVASNLFGDILSDLAPAVAAGGIGVAPSSNINPKERLGLFEPVHGSAPDIYGKGIANPIGQISSGAMMLRHLGQTEAANAIDRAIAKVLADGIKTGDLGGKSSTSEVGDAVAQSVATV